MNIEIRDGYSFVGFRASDSVEYYDAVIRRGYKGNKDYLAWDSAHKFGARMSGNNIASFRNGITIGERALEAAEFIDAEYRIAYSSCEEYGRSKKMKLLMHDVYDQAIQIYAVKIEVL